MESAQVSSHMTKKARRLLGVDTLALCIKGVSAAPSTMCRQLISQVAQTITIKLGAELHSATAANSLPPAKLKAHMMAMPMAESPC